MSTLVLACSVRNPLGNTLEAAARCESGLRVFGPALRSGCSGWVLVAAPPGGEIRGGLGLRSPPGALAHCTVAPGGLVAMSAV